MKRTLRVLAELHLPETVVLAQLVLLTAPVRLLIPIVSVRQAAGLMRRIGRHPLSGRLPFLAGSLPEDVLERMVDLAARLWFGRGRCLGRSLVLLALMEARGVRADLTIGVARDGEQVDSHAWVTAAGRVLVDQASNTNRFTTILHLEGD